MEIIPDVTTFRVRLA